jgi:hypothetical protein
MQKALPYRHVIVESFWLDSTAGHHNPVGIRPAMGQFYPTSMLVECSNRMRDPQRYAVGTQFEAWVRPKQKLDAKGHLYCYHGDPIVPVAAPGTPARPRAK